MLLLKLLERIIRNAAYNGAGLPSVKGMYEDEVPEELQK